MKWAPVMATVRETLQLAPETFIADGGWNFLDIEEENKTESADSEDEDSAFTGELEVIYIRSFFK